MRLKIRKISTAELLVMFLMFVLSGAMYTLPTTSYTNSKLLSVAVVFACDLLVAIVIFALASTVVI